MKKIRKALFALATLALIATSTGCGGGGGGGGSDDGDTPAAESGSSDSTGLVAVPGATFDGTAAITGSGVFIAGRTITIPSLLVCDHEVTQAEYQSVMGSNPSNFSGTNRPVENVSWYDALVYCNKRSINEGKTPCYTVSGVDFSGTVMVPSSDDPTWNAAECNFNANGYRLPTEAEWEYLARGGNLTNNGQTTYSGSNTIGDAAWYLVNACDVGSSSPDYGTHPVKTKAKNALNLYDMSGNVWEWCWDWYGSISTSTPSTGAALGSSRVGRGGGWIYYASRCAVSYRDFGSPINRYYGYGFRVVCSRSE